MRDSNGYNSRFDRAFSSSLESYVAALVDPHDKPRPAPKVQAPLCRGSRATMVPRRRGDRHAGNRLLTRRRGPAGSTARR